MLRREEVKDLKRERPRHTRSKDISLTRIHCSRPRTPADRDPAPTVALNARPWLQPGRVGAPEGLPRRDEGGRVLTLVRAAAAVRRLAGEG